MAYLLTSPRREVLIKYLNQPFTSFHIKPFRAQFNFTVTSLSAIFQSSSCIMNEADPLYSSSIFTCVVNAFSAYTATMLNILTIHAIRKTSSLPKPLKTLLLSLAVSDLGVGLLVQPLYVASIVSLTCFFKTVFKIIALLFVYASFFLVVAIGVDRFLAIHLHLRYQELVTHKRVVAVVISIWTLSLLFSLLIFYLTLQKPVLVVISAIFGFCCIITGIIYSRMFSTARYHENQIQVQVRNGGIAERRNGGITERRKVTPNPKRRNRRTAERRKMTPNPKRRHGGKSPEILNDGITENTPKS